MKSNKKLTPKPLSLRQRDFARSLSGLPNAALAAWVALLLK